MSVMTDRREILRQTLEGRMAEVAIFAVSPRPATVKLVDKDLEKGTGSMMDTRDGSVQTTLRIPGNWRHLGELIECMPAGFRLTPAALILPDGTEIEFVPLPADNQFAKIFRTSCRRQASRAELQIVDHYTVNVGLTGPGGSSAAALTMMQAGAAIVARAGAVCSSTTAAWRTAAASGSSWPKTAARTR